MKRLLFLGFILNSIVGYSQDTTLYKEYNKGPLTWWDFQASTIDELDISGQLYRSHTSHYTNNDFIEGGFGMYMYHVYVARNSSWYDPEFRNENSLIYFQNIFNISEYHERLKEREINLKISASRKTKGYLDTIAIIKNKYDRAEEIMVHRFKKAWLSESDSLKTAWLRRIHLQLDTLPRVTEMDYERTSNGLGIYLSGGYQPNSPNYHKYFGNQIEYLGFGFNVAYKKWLFDYKASIGGSSAKSNYTSTDFSFNKGEQINYGNFDLFVGRQLFKYKKTSFTPFIGGKLSQVSYYDDNLPVEGPFGYGYFGGGQLQFTWKEKPENIFSGVEFYAFYRGQYSKMYNMLDKIDGNQINHSIGVGFNIFTLKVTEFR